MKKTRTISVVNNKGGVTKSFSTMQIGSILAEFNYKVLLVDFDPQGNLSKNFNLKELDKPSIAEAILGKVDLNDIIKPTYRDNLYLVSSDKRLKRAEDTIKLDNRRSDNRLQKALNQIIESEDYDYIIIDNSPDTSVLLINSLTASDNVLIPVECDANSLEGFGLISEMVNEVKEDGNPKLEILGIFITKAEAHTRLHKDYISQVKESFGNLVFDTVIPKSVAAGDSLFAKLAMIDFDKSHKLTDSYKMLTKEIIKRLEK